MNVAPAGRPYLSPGAAANPALAVEIAIDKTKPPDLAKRPIKTIFDQPQGPNAADVLADVVVDKPHWSNAPNGLAGQSVVNEAHRSNLQHGVLLILETGTQEPDHPARMMWRRPQASPAQRPQLSAMLLEQCAAGG